jgi:hypothetical protein
MRTVIVLVAALLAGSALAAPGNWGGGPGNSGPGDKNSQNYDGHGGQQPPGQDR